MTTTKTSWRRRALALAAGTFGMLLASAVVSPAAHAHDGSIVCTLGTAHQEFSPALTPVTHQASVHEVGRIWGCSSPNHPDIVAADYTYEGQGDLNCLDGGNSSGTYKFHWEDAQGNPEGTTIIDWALLSLTFRPTGQNIAVGVGATTGGTHMHPGYMVYDEVLLTNPLDCLAGGVDEQDGVNVGMVIT